MSSPLDALSNAAKTGDPAAGLTVVASQLLPQPQSRVIEASSLNFVTHSHLTLDSSFLRDLLQQLVAGHNAHEQQIMDLRQQLHTSSPAQLRVQHSSFAASNPLETGTTSTPSHTTSSEPSPSSASPISAGSSTSQRPRGQRKVPTGADLNVTVEKLQCILGLQTKSGAAVANDFLGSLDTATHPEHLDASYDQLLKLPLFEAVCRRYSKASGIDAQNQQQQEIEGSLAQLIIQMRGIESKVELLSSSVETLRSICAANDKLASTSNKANTMQRMPSPVLPLGQSSAGVTDAQARIDIGRVSQDLILLRSRFESFVNETKVLKSPAAPESTPPLSKPPSGDAMVTLEQQDWNSRFATISKRMDALERSTKEAVSNTAKSSASGVKQQQQQQEISISPQPSESLLDPIGMIRTLEDRVFASIRMSKDSVLKSIHMQLDAFKSDLWAAMEDNERRRGGSGGFVHTFENSEEIEKQRLATHSSGTGDAAPKVGNANGGGDSPMTPQRPKNQYFSPGASSPYIPSREASVQASKMNPRNGGGLVGQRSPSAAPLPNAVCGQVSTPLVFRLGTPSAVPKERQQSTPARPASAMAISSSSRVAASSAVMPHHDTSSCVVWNCGWCAATRDQTPLWSSRPVSRIY